MSDPSTLIGGGAGVALITGAGTYLGIRLLNKGVVNNAPADVIFAASEKIREGLTVRLDGLGADVIRLTRDYEVERAARAECEKHTSELTARMLLVEARTEAADVAAKANAAAATIIATAEEAAAALAAEAEAARTSLVAQVRAILAEEAHEPTP